MVTHDPYPRDAGEPKPYLLLDRTLIGPKDLERGGRAGLLEERDELALRQKMDGEERREMQERRVGAAVRRALEEADNE